MFLLFQYWMTCRPDHWDQALNIESMFSHSDVSDVPILDAMSAWSMWSSIGYWVNLRPLRCFQCFNIECHVSLIHVVKYWISSQSLAAPMLPVFQYWMTYHLILKQWKHGSGRRLIQYSMPDPNVQADMSSNIETLQTSEWLKIDSIVDAWLHESGWHTIQYLNIRNIGVAKDWLIIQCMTA